MELQSLHAEVKRLLLEKLTTMIDIAEKIHVSRVTLSKVKCGKKVSAGKLLEIREKLKELE